MDESNPPDSNTPYDHDLTTEDEDVVEPDDHSNIGFFEGGYPEDDYIVELGERDEDDDDNDDEEEEDEDEDDDDDDDGWEVQVEVEEEENDAEIERIQNRRRQILRLLASADIRRLFAAAQDGDDVFDAAWAERHRRAAPDPNRFPKVPSVVGEELMASGDFGSNDARNSIGTDARNSSATGDQITRRKRLARRILDREIASGGFASQKINQRMMAQEMLPSSNADMIINYNHPVYSGQFSDDGNFFFAVNKDFRVRMYDTSNPYNWRYYKTVDYHNGQWTLTDASLSPDNKYLAYTSIRSVVCLAPTDPNDMGDPYNLDLADNGRTGGYRGRNGGAFGIWSVRFSGDGSKLVAGTTGGSIVLYDIESRRSLHRIYGHEEDVNAVCFADKSSPHILYSGSDDRSLKVWDTRSMGDSREAGAFVGHIEGLTYIDSKGDGRYVLSNGKDQSMKLWDLRMVMTSRQFAQIKSSGRRPVESHFDYRYGSYDEDDWYQDPNDNSLVTFRGHKVLRTLIRCHFSPPGSTNSRYVYSGSEDGKVYIWNMDATLAGKIDVFKATRNTRPRDHTREAGRRWLNDDDVSYHNWKTCVRDASWHPTAPVIVASAWNGYGLSTGTCTAHSWNDGAEDDEAEPRMGLRVTEKLEEEPNFDQIRDSQPRRPERRWGQRARQEDDSDFEDDE